MTCRCGRSRRGFSRCVAAGTDLAFPGNAEASDKGPAAYSADPSRTTGGNRGLEFLLRIWGQEFEPRPLSEARRNGTNSCRYGRRQGVRILERFHHGVLLAFGAASLVSGGSTTGPPAEINDDFNHSWSNVVGGGPGEVFALSCALSRHQGHPCPQCAARSWISAHRPYAVFPALFRQRVWVFRPWQPHIQAKRVQPLGNLAGAPATNRTDATA